MAQYEFTTLEEVADLCRKHEKTSRISLLRTTHGMWVRFNNYEKHPPMVIRIDGEIASIVFFQITKNRYMNLYEIISLPEYAGKGYGTDLWKSVIKFACENQAERLKISCTPESILWHYPHGLIFWGVDKSGSLRSDQQLFPTIEEQVEYRRRVIEDPQHNLPPVSQVNKFKKEIQEIQFGENKKIKIQQAIKSIGSAWLAPYLY